MLPIKRANSTGLNRLQGIALLRLQPPRPHLTWGLCFCQRKSYKSNSEFPTEESVLF